MVCVINVPPRGLQRSILLPPFPPFDSSNGQQPKSDTYDQVSGMVVSTTHCEPLRTTTHSVVFRDIHVLQYPHSLQVDPDPSTAHLEPLTGPCPRGLIVSIEDESDVPEGFLAAITSQTNSNIFVPAVMLGSVMFLVARKYNIF